jgi:ubiquinone/menaquinone biosynthesis C-methylase UbiE
VDPFDPRAITAAYDTVAPEYASAFGDDLAQLPVDRAFLDALDRAPAGVVLDVGCGPAAVASRLTDRGRRVIGVDRSGAMLRVAAARNPGLYLLQADIRQLPLPAQGCAGVAAYYCIQHVRRQELAALLREFSRVLIPGGLLALATHLGEGEVVSTEFLGHHVDPVAGALYPAGEVLDQVRSAGFELVRTERRQPLAHEHPTERIYVLARSC